ncbi:MAG TPA: hypothetical protein QGG70_03255 [Candidatus Pacearchaeota archaeon]|nr:hypothetical protein [Candidatus Pacearchaeota archaeon]
MFMKNKRGSTAGNIVTSLIVGFALLVILLTAFSVADETTPQSGIIEVVSNSMNTAKAIFLTVLGPIFNVLLDLGGPGDPFLKVLSFVLVFIIILGTLDSVDIFGAGGSKMINFLVGMIVAAIGVRFMPENMWTALTAPSSAFVATILAAIPFLALWFVTSKIESSLVTKGMWLFYLLTIGYIAVQPQFEYRWIYVIFAVAALMMILGETIIRKWVFKETAKVALQKTVGIEYTIRLAEIEARLQEIIPLEARSRSPAIKDSLNKEIEDLKNEYKEKAGKAYTK